MTKDDLFELLFSSDVKAQEKALALIKEELENEKPSIDIPALVTFSFARPYLDFRELSYEKFEAMRKEGNRRMYSGHDEFVSFVYELSPICEKARLLIERLPKKPKKLDYRIELEYIKYVCEKGDSRTIKKLIELTSFDDGKSLCWHGSRVKELPEEFLSFPKLKNVEFYTAFLKTFPSVLIKATQLEEINIYSSKISSIPKEIKHLKNLKKLSIIRNLLESVPEEIGELSQLEEIDFTKNKLAELPVSMAKLKNLKSIALASNSITSAAQVQKLFALFYENSTPLLTRQVWIHLIFARIEQAIKLDSLVDIISALNTKLELLKNSAMQALDRISELGLKSNPLKNDSVIGVCGYVDELESIREELLERGLKLSEELDDQCTHLLIGESPEFESLPNASILTPNLLRGFMQGEEVPLFLNEAEDSANAQQRLNDLLLSNDERNQYLAFEMLKSLGMSQDIVANLYYLFRVTANKEIKAMTKSLLLQNASSDFMQIINKNQSYTNCSEPGFIRYLNDLQTVDDLDVIYFAKLIYKNMEYGINFLFATKEPEIITYVLRKNIEKYGYLNLRYSHLSYLPEEVGQFVELKKIDLDGNKIKKLPESIGNLRNLETLLLYDNKITKLPKSFAKLKNLSYVSFTANNLKTFPNELLSLRALNTLHLCRIDSTSLPDDLSCLDRLKVLTYTGAKTRQLPIGLFSLTSLESLDVSHTEIDGIQDKISQLVNLKCLDLTCCDLHKFPAAVFQLSSLEELILNSNRIQKYPKEVTSFAKLKLLNIRSNGLVEFPGNITNIEPLEELDLLHNEIDVFPKSLSKLKNLKKLSIGRSWDSKDPVTQQAQKLVAKGCKVE